MGLFTTKTRECHNCGYVAEDCDVGYTERLCPYCGTMMLNGDIIQRGSAKLQEEVVLKHTSKVILTRKRCTARDAKRQNKIPQINWSDSKRNTPNVKPHKPVPASPNVRPAVRQMSSGFPPQVGSEAPCSSDLRAAKSAKRWSARTAAINGSKNA